MGWAHDQKNAIDRRESGIVLLPVLFTLCRTPLDLLTSNNFILDTQGVKL